MSEKADLMATGLASQNLKSQSSLGQAEQTKTAPDVDHEVEQLPSEDQNPPPYSIYSRLGKSLIVLGASLAALISPLTGQIYLPALNAIAEDLQITAAQVNLTITTYMIFQGITPMFIGGLADGAGRRPAYIICFVFFIASNIGLALVKNYASLMVVRCIQSAGSASTVALCQAVVADIVISAERGQYIGITVIPVVFGPSLGPVLGGILSQYLGWRSIFWFLAIVGAVLGLFVLLFLPETCRAIVGNGSIRPHPLHQTVYQLVHDALEKRKAHKSELSRTTTKTSTASRRYPKIRLPNPLRSLQMIFQKEIGLLLYFSSIIFAGYYAIATALPARLRESYGMDDLTIGLMYLPTAGGSIFAAFVVGPFIDWNYRRHAAKLGILVEKKHQQDLVNFPIETVRLEVGAPLFLLTALTMLVWGFALDHHAHVAVLCVLMFLNGAGMIGFGNASNTLLVDITPGRAGAAVAANNFCRCLVGAVGVAVITPMIDGMGISWAFFLLGMIFIISMPLLLLLSRNGIAWRKELRDKEEKKRQKAELNTGDIQTRRPTE